MHTDVKDDDEEISQATQAPTALPEATSSSKPSYKVTLDELVCLLLSRSTNHLDRRADPSSIRCQRQYLIRPSPTLLSLPPCYAETYSMLGFS